MIADLALKATALLAAGCVAAFLLRRRDASTRHAVWSGLMGAALLLPLVAAVAPSIEVPLLPAAAARAARITPVPVAARELAVPTDRTGSLADASRVTLDAGADDARAASRGPASALPAISLTQIALGAWLAVALLLIARLAAAHLQARGLLHACGDPSTRLRDALASVCRSLGIVTPGLRIAPSGTMPAVIGVRRPAIVLPSDAETWTRERLDLVLLHECAHVRRRDALMQVIASVATAAYWWHPLAWIAARNIVRERELACDDLVVATGTPASRYAEHLLDIARSMKSSRQPALAALAMARPSQLEGRLIALLEERPRGAKPGRAVAAGLSLAAVALLAVAPIKLVARAVIAPDGTALATEGAQAPAPAAAARPEAITDADAQAKPGAQRDPALSAAMLKALDDPDADVRQIALASLLRSDNPAVVAHLARAMNDPSEDVRRVALAGVQALGHPDRRALVLQAASDTSEDVRSLAALGLAEEQGEAIAPALAKLAQDISEDVRQAAIMAIASRRGDGAGSLLAAALSDRDEDVRAAAAIGLGSIGDKSAVAALTTALKDAHADVRAAAAIALGSIGDETSVRALTGAMSDADADVRKAAIAAAAAIDGDAMANTTIASTIAGTIAGTITGTIRGTLWGGSYGGRGREVQAPPPAPDAPPAPGLDTREDGTKIVVAAGHVVQPGKHDWRDGMTAAELVRMAGGPSGRGSLNRMVIRRYEAGAWKEYPARETSTLQPGDELVVGQRRF